MMVSKSEVSKWSSMYCPVGLGERAGSILTKGFGFEGEGLADSKAPLPSRNAVPGALEPDSGPEVSRNRPEDIATSKGTGAGTVELKRTCCALFKATQLSTSVVSL